MGRHVFGAASLLLGVASLALHDQLTSNWQLPGEPLFLFLMSIAQIGGGLAMQFQRTVGIGAAVLGGVYLIFAITWVPDVIAQPDVYASWGEVFYRLASVCGAAIAYVFASSPAPRARAVRRGAALVYGLCSLSFAAEQVEFLAHTASLVPKWVPGGGAAGAVATTVAFALTGIALISGYAALLAARLVTAMLVGFDILIWIPTLIADPRTHSNWSEGLETLLIGGAGWIVADALARKPVDETAHAHG